MARPVMLGNGALTVGLNEHGLVHDFYYPYVGLDNLTTSRSVHHKIGVWVDGVFSWVDDGTWQVSINSEENALISAIRLKSTTLGIELAFQDFVDPEENVFCRNISVNNLTDRQRDCRLFMHQVFQISRGGRGDTALFVPDESYLLDYKGRVSLLIYGEDETGQVFDQFAVGNYGIEGKEGTYKDAEDGELSGSAVEHGGVDSVIRFSLNLPAGGSSDVHYWIIAADSQFDAQKIHQKIKKQGFLNRLEATREHWRQWLSIAANGLHMTDNTYLELTKKSLMIIKSHMDKRGGIIASCDSSIYNYGRDYYSYVWPRDGAFVIWPLIRLGYRDEPKAFFGFCRDILTKDGYLMHKYQPDKSIGSTWHPMLHGRRSELAIQEDESAIVIFMLHQYLLITGDQDFAHGLYDTLIEPIATFLSEFIDEETGLPHASYDLWEEKFGTSTYTTAVTYRALLCAAEFAERFEFPDDAVRWKQAAARIEQNVMVLVDPETNVLRKGLLYDHDNGLTFDNTLDASSFYGVQVFDLPFTDANILHATLEAMDERLFNKSPSGGMTRYEGDSYFSVSNDYPGNPWIITTLWYAQFCVRIGKTDEAHKYLDWVQQKALSSGVLPEQIDPETSTPLSVTPLVWSHAEFINTVLDVALANEGMNEAQK